MVKGRYHCSENMTMKGEEQTRGRVKCCGGGGGGKDEVRRNCEAEIVGECEEEEEKEDEERND